MRRNLKRTKSGLHSIGSQRQTIQSAAGGIKNGAADCRRNGHNWRFASARRRNIFAVDQNRLYFWNIAETRHAIRRKMRICDTPVVKFDSFEEPSPYPLNDCADNLIAQTVGIDDAAALEGFHNLHNAYCSRNGIHGNFHARGYITTFLVADRQTEALPILRFSSWPA